MGDDVASPGVFVLKNTRLEVEEGGMLQVHLQRASGQSGAASVDIVLTAATASTNDFDPHVIQVDFEPGETNKLAQIAIVEDDEMEMVELFLAGLANPSSGAAIGWQSSAEARIL